MRPTCITENCMNLAKPNGYSSKGKVKFYKKCSPCLKKRYPNKYGEYIKQTFCKFCGFRGHRCQLDVDHINGNKKDNSTENLQTLCANCHRLKTFNNKDWN